MTNPLFLLILFFIVAYSAYLLLAVVLDLIIHKRITTECVKQMNSLLICAVAAVLPHRIREVFILIMHFILHSLKNKLLLVFNAMMYLVLLFVCVFVYFIGFPITIGLEHLSSSEPRRISEDLLRRY